MRNFLWKVRAKGFRLISAFISREGRKEDRVFAAVEKDGVKYNYDGRSLIENSGIEGEYVDIDRIDMDKIDENCPDGRHMILINSSGVRILIPNSLSSVKVVEMTLEGRVLREYEMDIGGV